MLYRSSPLRAKLSPSRDLQRAQNREKAVKGVSFITNFSIPFVSFITNFYARYLETETLLLSFAVRGSDFNLAAIYH